MKHDYLFVLALPSESNGRIEKLGHPTLYTGCGKLNAALMLSQEIMHTMYMPRIVINVGTAASPKFDDNRVVLVKRFVQRDMLCEPLAPKFHTPFDPVHEAGYIDLCCSFTKRIETVSCGTGDSFVRIDQMGTCDFDIVDMEGYALAKTCQAFKHPFISLKCLTDTGCPEKWKANLDEASKALAREAANLLDEIKASAFPDYF